MISCSDGHCTVTGPITLANVTGVLRQGAELFRDGVVIDLSGVTEVDSAAVSLLLEWRRVAAAREARVTYVNLPANLRTLADLYGVSDLIDAS